jgi:hypothetical protein
MTSSPPHVQYTTNLAKAQGLVPETLELLALWQPGMSTAALTALVKETGALGRATATRISDVVGRGFGQRYLVESGKPALWLKRLAASSFSRSALRQLLLVFTARHNPIFHDYIADVYWRNLLGTLEDFQMIGENRFGSRHATPPAISPETVLFLAHDLHFRETEDKDIPRHPDWQLFGLHPADVTALLDRTAAQGHFQLQNAGQILRIEWIHPDMDHLIDALSR